MRSAPPRRKEHKELRGGRSLFWEKGAGFSKKFYMFLSSSGGRPSSLNDYRLFPSDCRLVVFWDVAYISLCRVDAHDWPHHGGLALRRRSRGTASSFQMGVIHFHASGSELVRRFPHRNAVLALNEHKLRDGGFLGRRVWGLARSS